MAGLITNIGLVVAAVVGFIGDVFGLIVSEPVLGVLFGLIVISSVVGISMRLLHKARG